MEILQQQWPVLTYSLGFVQMWHQSTITSVEGYDVCAVGVHDHQDSRVG
jgi:hypothetical protein